MFVSMADTHIIDHAQLRRVPENLQAPFVPGEPHDKAYKWHMMMICTRALRRDEVRIWFNDREEVQVVTIQNTTKKENHPKSS